MVKMVITGEYIFVVGEQSPVGLGKVRKIRKEKDKHYIVFLDNNQEVDVIADNLIVVTNY